MKKYVILAEQLNFAHKVNCISIGKSRTDYFAFVCGKSDGCNVMPIFSLKIKINDLEISVESLKHKANEMVQFIHESYKLCKL